jgi:hypothetical protein
MEGLILLNAPGGETLKLATVEQVLFSLVRLSAAQLDGSGVLLPAVQFVGPVLITPMGSET